MLLVLFLDHSFQHKASDAAQVIYLNMYSSLIVVIFRVPGISAVRNYRSIWQQGKHCLVDRLVYPLLIFGSSIQHLFMRVFDGIKLFYLPSNPDSNKSLVGIDNHGVDK